MKRVALISLFLLSIGFISTSFAVEVTCYGPEQFIRLEEDTAGAPTVYTDTFPGVDDIATLKISNGDAYDKHRISSAEIWVNDKLVVGPNHFKKKVNYFEIAIPLKDQNTITVKLYSKPSCYLNIIIEQNIDAVSATLIGSNGGIIEISDPKSNLYGLKIEIPENSLDHDIILTINEINAEPTLQNEALIVGPSVNFGPGGTHFNSEIKVSLPYYDYDDDGILDRTDISEEKVCAINFDPYLYRWLFQKKIEYNEDSNTITFATDHFSKYAPAGVMGSLYGSDEIYIFTIDGLSFSKIALPGLQEDSRPSYLKPALIAGMSLGLKEGDVYSYGDGNRESWSGDANYTEDIIPTLVKVLRSEYFKSQSMNKKFILVTHSWGTVLGTLSLMYSPEVQPDLYLTLSSPYGSTEVSGYENDIFSYFPLATVDEAHKAINFFILKESLDVRKRMDSLGIQGGPLNLKNWINYWAMGDLISGPIDSKFDTSIKDKKFDTQNIRDIDTTPLYHAVTSIDAMGVEYFYDEEGAWLKHLTTIQIETLAKPFRRAIESEIKSLISPVNDKYFTAYYKDPHIRGRFISSDKSMSDEIILSEHPWPDYTIWSPEFAYDNVNKRYLVIWWERFYEFSNSYRMVGQFVSEKGDLIDDNFQIVDSYFSYCSRYGSGSPPSIAFDSNNNRYFIVIGNNCTAVGGVGFFINSNGEYLGNEINIPWLNYEVAIAFEEKNSTYFCITAQRFRPVKTVLGQKFDCDGQSLSEVIDYDTGYESYGGVNISYNNNLNKYLIYYWTFENSRGFYIDTNGEKLTQDFHLINGDNGHLVYNESNRDYLIYYNGSGRRVLGQFINENGTLNGDSFLIAEDAWWNYPY